MRSWGDAHPSSMSIAWSGRVHVTLGAGVLLVDLLLKIDLFILSWLGWGFYKTVGIDGSSILRAEARYGKGTSSKLINQIVWLVFLSRQRRRWPCKHNLRGRQHFPLSYIIIILFRDASWLLLLKTLPNLIVIILVHAEGRSSWCHTELHLTVLVSWENTL